MNQCNLICEVCMVTPTRPKFIGSLNAHGMPVYNQVLGEETWNCPVLS